MDIFRSLKFRLALPCYGPCKMANFATFQRRGIFLILSVFLSSFVHRTTLMILKGSFCMFLVTILLCYNLCNGHFCHLLKIVPFLECEVFFFSAVSWHSATLVLFLLFVPSARRAQGTMLSCIRVRP